MLIIAALLPQGEVCNLVTIYQPHGIYSGRARWDWCISHKANAAMFADLVRRLVGSAAVTFVIVPLCLIHKSPTRIVAARCGLTTKLTRRRKPERREARNERSKAQAVGGRVQRLVGLLFVRYARSFGGL